MVKLTLDDGYYFQSIKNINNMEKRLRIKRCNPFLIRESQDDTPCILVHAPDTELAAKDMLFQLSDNQGSPKEEKTCKINQWFNASDDSLHQSPFSSIKQLPDQHKSLYITRKTQLAKVRTQTSQERHLELSVIPHLKSHLRKLESPEKGRPAETGREAKAQKLKVKDENLELNVIKTTQITPKSECRHKNASLYKKTKKSIFLQNFPEGKTRNAISRQRTCYEIRDISERLEFIKEARRNRTLRKLLF